jgi:hypothetical protein
MDGGGVWWMQDGCGVRGQAAPWCDMCPKLAVRGSTGGSCYGERTLQWIHQQHGVHGGAGATVCKGEQVRRTQCMRGVNACGAPQWGGSGGRSARGWGCVCALQPGKVHQGKASPRSIFTWTISPLVQVQGRGSQGVEWLGVAHRADPCAVTTRGLKSHNSSNSRSTSATQRRHLSPFIHVNGSHWGGDGPRTYSPLRGLRHCKASTGLQTCTSVQYKPQSESPIPAVTPPTNAAGTLQSPDTYAPVDT